MNRGVVRGQEYTVDKRDVSSDEHSVVEGEILDEPYEQATARSSLENPTGRVESQESRRACLRASRATVKDWGCGKLDHRHAHASQPAATIAEAREACGQELTVGHWDASKNSEPTVEGVNAEKMGKQGRRELAERQSSEGEGAERGQDYRHAPTDEHLKNEAAVRRRPGSKEHASNPSDAP
ncbi:uncharacterized protein C8Q71DRAFT_854358 [Rhodofomes roseus]|uniref:DUF2382 domain-containing protein n=1 Tax=Rhodofomes roseus TaxID=34475 RepID=A0ABQ8KT39_9APHY|nr:uncharacterized protein C8Q71DRAFT_854358 [Rhodofomes roseus]KAH9842003.1 hypothetical protein C8Q71DRAFT_854358 [Rhodofomes roseus]